jgi:hypothetical protein
MQVVLYSRVTQMTEMVFDEFSKIRIIDPEKYDASEKLKEQCSDFIKSWFCLI